MYLSLEIKVIRMSISSSPTAKTTVKLLPASTKKLGKYNDLLAQFSGDETAMMDWAKKRSGKRNSALQPAQGKKSQSPFPLLPVFPWTKSVSSTSAICSFSSSVLNCGSITSAEISVTITGLLTTSMPSLRI